MILDIVYVKAKWYYENIGAIKHSFLVLEPLDLHSDVLVTEKNFLGVHFYRLKRHESMIHYICHNGK